MHAFVPPLMGRDEIAAYYDLYVPDRTDRSDIRFAPLAGRLENLPPALVVTAGQDLFADEGARYAAALAQAGVRSEEHTSELQSLMRISYAVFCLKKKKKK